MVRGNDLKNGEPTFGFSFMAMLCIQVSFGHGFNRQKSVTTQEHPPFSPDLTAADFYLFP